MDFTRYATHLEIFVDVVRLGSFAATARRRGVAISSIVRRVDALEADLQTRLLVRSTRVLTLTDAGEKLFLRAQDIINRLVDIRSEIGVFAETPSGVLRVSALPTFSRLHLIPIVAKLLKIYPDLTIELDLTERLADPANERCDAAIRIGEQPDSGLFATRIGVQRWIICAAPEYLKRYGYPIHIDDIASHRRIGKTPEMSGIGWGRLPIRGKNNVRHVFRCDEFDAQRFAARAGIGLAMLPNWVVYKDIEAGYLVPLLEEETQETQPIYILRALPDAPPKLSVFIEALRKHFGEAALAKSMGIKHP